LRVCPRKLTFTGLKKTLSTFEPLINSRLQYPYVFLNDEPFTDEFKNEINAEFAKYRSNVDVEYSLIPKEHWSYPDHIDQEKSRNLRKEQSSQYIYGGSESYRFMIRYFSGPFYLHPGLQKYDYYWRVEPDVEFYCELDYDPFLFMQKREIKYGFSIMMNEIMRTIPTLMSTIKAFQKSTATESTNVMRLFNKTMCGGGFIHSGSCEGEGDCCSRFGYCGKGYLTLYNGYFSLEFCSAAECASSCPAIPPRPPIRSFGKRLPSTPKMYLKETFKKELNQHSLEKLESLGFCGVGSRGNGTCEKSSECCSVYGHCGTDWV
jgi:hypothetical protein